MNATRKRMLIAVLLCAGPSSGAQAARELSLSDAMELAEKNSPLLKAASLHEQASLEGIGVARAAYLPSVAGDAIDSWGFPGSSGYLGIGGLMGSPYRSGKAAGVVARQTLLDFGRTASGVKAAEAASKRQHEAAAADRYSLDLDVLQTFYECSRFRSETEVWDSLHHELDLVAQEVSRFVDTGQRSIVDRYLSRAQVEEARTNRNFFKSREGSTADRLALLAGAEPGALSCPPLPSPAPSAPPPAAESVNPYVLEARAEVELAQDRLSEAKSDYLPRIVGVASAGAMDRSRLVARTDYSGGLGLILPLFDGLGTVHRVGQARAEMEAKVQELGAVELRMKELEARYDEVAAASRARIEHLDHEQTLAREGFRVAKGRYEKFQGTLVDLRDALRNLGRIETDLEDTRANLLEAAGAKALLNGRRP